MAYSRNFGGVPQDAQKSWNSHGFGSHDSCRDIPCSEIKKVYSAFYLEQNLYLNEYDERCRLDLGNIRSSRNILVLR